MHEIDTDEQGNLAAKEAEPIKKAFSREAAAELSEAAGHVRKLNGNLARDQHDNGGDSTCQNDGGNDQLLAVEHLFCAQFLAGFVVEENTDDVNGQAQQEIFNAGGPDGPDVEHTAYNADD